MKTKFQTIAAVLVISLIVVSQAQAGPPGRSFGRGRGNSIISHRITRPFHRPYRSHRQYSTSSFSITRPGFHIEIKKVAPPVIYRVPIVRTVKVIEPVYVPPVEREVIVETSPDPTEIVKWIQNDNGSLTSVKLTQQGPGFIGPRGEYYPELPTDEQLKILYGLR